MCIKESVCKDIEDFFLMPDKMELGRADKLK